MVAARAALSERPGDTPVAITAPLPRSWEERHFPSRRFCPFCDPPAAFLTAKSLRQHAKRKHGASPRTAKLLAEAVGYEAAHRSDL